MWGGFGRPAGEVITTTDSTREPFVDLQQVADRNQSARLVVAGFSTALPTLADIWRHLEAALADTPTLAAEIGQLRTRLRDIRMDRANLLAAARATIGAYLDGEADPLSYLHDELDARGQLPGSGL